MLILHDVIVHPLIGVVKALSPSTRPALTSRLHDATMSPLPSCDQEVVVRCDWCDGKGLGAYLADASGLDQHCPICGGSGTVDPARLTEQEQACLRAARRLKREA